MLTNACRTARIAGLSFALAAAVAAAPSPQKSEAAKPGECKPVTLRQQAIHNLEVILVV